MAVVAATQGVVRAVRGTVTEVLTVPDVPDETQRVGTNLEPDAWPLTPSGLCKKCQQRKATEVWIGDNGALGLSHGLYLYWCKRCVVESQLAYCRTAAARIPLLEQALAELLGEGRSGD